MNAMKVLEDVFELDADEFSEATILDEMDEWDSMTKLSLIVACKHSFGKTISGDDMKSFVTVGDIIKFLES